MCFPEFQGSGLTEISSHLGWGSAEQPRLSEQTHILIYEISRERLLNKLPGGFLSASPDVGEAVPAARKRLRPGFGLRQRETMIHDTDEAKATAWNESEDRNDADLLTLCLRVKRLPNSQNKSPDSYKSLTNELVTEGHMDPTRHSDFYCVRKTEKWRNLDGSHSDGSRSQEKRERRNISRPVNTSKR